MPRYIITPTYPLSTFSSFLVDILGEKAQKQVKQSLSATILKQALCFWSDLGKIYFSARWSVQITCLSSQMKTKHSQISNEPPSSYFGAPEGLQNPSARWHCVFA